MPAVQNPLDFRAHKIKVNSFPEKKKKIMITSKSRKLLNSFNY